MELAATLPDANLYENHGWISGSVRRNSSD
jgi:hypothetical protein